MVPKTRGKQGGKGEATSKTTPKKIAKIKKTSLRKRKVFFTSVNPKQPQQEDPAVIRARNHQLNLDNLQAYFALGWRPTATPVRIGNERATATDKNGNQYIRRAALCGIHALQMSLHAARTLNEPGYGPDDYLSPADIVTIWRSQAYQTKVDERLIEYDGTGVMYDELRSTTYDSQEYLDRQVLSLLLGIINDQYGLSYRLGVYTVGGDHPGSVDIDGVTGPIVWVFNRGKGDDSHYVSFTPQPLEDPLLLEIPTVASLSISQYETRVRELIGRGLYRIIQHTNHDADGGGANPEGWVGEFVFVEPNPNDNELDDHIWGHVANNQDVLDTARIGWMALEDLQQITAAVTQGDDGQDGGGDAGIGGATGAGDGDGGLLAKEAEDTVRLAGVKPVFPKPLTIDADMEELVMHFTTRTSAQGAKKGTAGKWTYGEDDLMLQIKPVTKNGWVRVRDINGKEGDIRLEHLERIRQPWGISQISQEGGDETPDPDPDPDPNKKAGTVDYTDREAWPFPRLKAEIKKRREEGRFTVGPQHGFVKYIAFLEADDEKYEAEQAKSGKPVEKPKPKPKDKPAGKQNAGFPLDIRRVTEAHITNLSREQQADYYRTSFVLFLQDDGENHTGIASITGQPIQLPTSDLEMTGVPNEPWGIRVPNNHPSSTVYNAPSRDVHDIIREARDVLRRLIDASEVQAELDAAQNLLNLFDARADFLEP